MHCEVQRLVSQWGLPSPAYGTAAPHVHLWGPLDGVQGPCAPSGWKLPSAPSWREGEREREREGTLMFELGTRYLNASWWMADSCTRNAFWASLRSDASYLNASRWAVDSCMARVGEQGLLPGLICARKVRPQPAFIRRFGHSDIV